MPSLRHHFQSLFFAVACVALAGCATDKPANTYSVGNSGELDGRAAEAAVASSFSASLAGKFDQPVRLIRAPQPSMPPQDIRADVSGRVVVEVVFDESGGVERVTPVSSTKASLTEAVLRAVGQWRIEPVTLGGQPQKLTTLAPFEFRVAP